MRIEDIEIHVGKIDFDYEPIRRLEAKCEATMAFSPAPTVEEMNGKLRSMAAKLGANAVIDVEYKSGASMTSWKSMKGTGTAVRKTSDTMACPACAETIKCKATKCRHCGETIDQLTAADTRGLQHGSGEDLATSALVPSVSPALPDEPLRETNNPQLWLIAGAVLFVLFMIVSATG